MNMMEDEGDQDLMQTTQRKKKDKNTRRFTDEQISSLESIFKVETKLEPRKKLQLAQELGLHPRQVAIWFQNRRARWKSKQIEQDYTLLKSNYDNLTSKFDSLNKENQSLLIQLQELRGKFKNQDSSMIVEGNFNTSSTDESESELHGEKTRELKEDPNLCSDDDNIEFKNKMYADAHGDEDADVSLVPTDERWCNLESGGMLNWWDYST